MLSKVRRIANHQISPATFNLFAGNLHCKHNFFGACHTATYVRLLRLYRGKRANVSLLKAGNIDEGYRSLGFGVEDITAVFRTLSDVEQASSGGSELKEDSIAASKTGVAHVHTGNDTKDSIKAAKEPCRFFPLVWHLVCLANRFQLTYSRTFALKE